MDEKAIEPAVSSSSGLWAVWATPVTLSVLMV